MGHVAPFHSINIPENPVFHIYSDCPAGQLVIRDANDTDGEGGLPVCKFCRNKLSMGSFLV